MSKKSARALALEEYHKLVRDLWKEAQQSVDSQWGGAGMAPLHEVVIEFDRLRVLALKSHNINQTVTALESIPKGESGFLHVLPYVLVQEGKLIPYQMVDELEIPPGETIH